MLRQRGIGSQIQLFALQLHAAFALGGYQAAHLQGVHATTKAQTQSKFRIGTAVHSAGHGNFPLTLGHIHMQKAVGNL